MSLNQWKLINQLKDSITKISNDNQFQNVIGKDLKEILQKVSFSSADILKYFDTNKEIKSNGQNTHHLPNIVQTLSPKKAKECPEPKWKTPVLSKSSIASQTNHVILSIQMAETDEALNDKLEALISHMKQFPEIKNAAIKTGIIHQLLRIRRKNTNKHIQSTLQEALALLGYCDPVPGRGIRILSMDGGGIRGLLILEMLKKLEELTGKRVHELFDLFCGVSTGAILTFSIGINNKNLDEIAKGYQSISTEIFKQSAIWGTGNLVWSHSYYDTTLWEQKLKEHLGDSPLISTARIPNCPKLCAVSAIVNQSQLSAYLFRNYCLPWQVKSQYLGSCLDEVWQAARASAAAPTYFEEFKLGQYLHQDGGILINNPTAVALHEAKLLWPNSPIQCIVSFGTGRTVHQCSDLKNKPNESNNTSWTNKFYKILDSATDTEGVHTILNDLLPDKVYYRFNPYLTDAISMVETDPTKLEQLKRDAIMYLRKNEDKFQEAAKVLMQQKTPVQKIKDKINSYRNLYGV